MSESGVENKVAGTEIKSNWTRHIIKLVLYFSLGLLLFSVAFKFITASFDVLIPKVVNINNTKIAIIINDIQEIAKIETIEFMEEVKINIENYKKVEMLNREFKWPLTHKNLFLIGQGYVVAGVDASKIDQDCIHITNGFVYISDMPEAEILHGYIDSSTLEVMCCNESLFAKIEPEEVTQELAIAQENLVNVAIEKGILDMANKKARDEIESKLTFMGAKGVYFDSFALHGN